MFPAARLTPSIVDAPVVAAAPFVRRYSVTSRAAGQLRNFEKIKRSLSRMASSRPDYAALAIVRITVGKWCAVHPFARSRHSPTVQPRLDEMQLDLAHGAFEAEQDPS